MDRYDALALGIQSIDAEHHHLIELFNAFLACLKEEGLGERARAIVEEALTATNEHFEHEEQLMAETGYPGVEEEEFEHRLLRLHLTTLVGDVINTGAGHCDRGTLDHLDTMRRLFSEHIAGADRKFAEYLIANEIR